MLIEFQQSGGVAGIRRPPHVIDTTTLPAEEARDLHDLIDGADFFNRPTAEPGGPRRDAFSYRITVRAGDRVHTIDTQGGAAPLRALVERLRTLAGARPGGSSGPASGP